MKSLFLYSADTVAAHARHNIGSLFRIVSAVPKPDDILGLFKRFFDHAKSPPIILFAEIAHAESSELNKVTGAIKAILASLGNNADAHTTVAELVERCRRAATSATTWTLDAPHFITAIAEAASDFAEKI